jgi:hypothetical protein
LHTSFRNNISFNDEDRVLHDDMVKAIEFVNSYKI